MQYIIAFIFNNVQEDGGRCFFKGDRRAIHWGQLREGSVSGGDGLGLPTPISSFFGRRGSKSKASSTASNLPKLPYRAPELNNCEGSTYVHFLRLPRSSVKLGRFRDLRNTEQYAVKKAMEKHILSKDFLTKAHTHVIYVST
jgi:hypothetical protein